MAKYDIFISYRREGGYDTAKHLYDLLTRDGYKVSFDIDTLSNGDFDKSLLERIDQCKDFILIVDSHAFDRTLNPKYDQKNDWMRQELAYALKKGKNIVPIFLNGVQGFPENLPKDIIGVVKKNGPKFDRYYFNDFYKKLKKSFLKAHSKRYSIIISSVILILLLIGCTFIFSNLGRSGADHPLIQDSAINIEEQVNETEDQTEDILDDILSFDEVEYKKKMQRFCGSFTYIIPNRGYGGINYVYNLVLDPIDSSCSIQEEGIVNITNSKGFYGTMMQYPEIWEVISFSLALDGSHAIASMIGGDNCICKVKLELDSYNNIQMSFVEGTDGPGLLYDSKGDMTNVVTFERDT